MTVLIPSYEPDHRLLGLVRKLKEMTSAPIVIVDDGSGEAYRDIFHSAKQAGCTVLTHAKNLGKGSALKTGFAFIKESGEPSGVVCADSDGQHLPEDIMNIAKTVEENPGHIVLGSRRFTGTVPLRSKFGNSVTRWVYKAATGRRIQDTQTGLRGFSVKMLDWLLRVPGERFEYEMNMLLKAPSDGYQLHEVTIDTVYLEENKSSHFRPLIDSARVYLPFLKFAASSAASAVLDFALLFLLQFLTNNLLVSVIGSRLGSSIFNFSMNRTFVFSQQRGLQTSMPRYYALVLLILALNYAMLSLLYETAGLPLIAAKVITEVTLYALSYWMQRKFVY